MMVMQVVSCIGLPFCVPIMATNTSSRKVVMFVSLFVFFFLIHVIATLDALTIFVCSMCVYTLYKDTIGFYFYFYFYFYF